MSDLEPIFKIVQEITKALKPLVDAAKQTPPGSGIIDFVRNLGWDLDGYVQLSDLGNFASNVSNTWDALEGIIEDPTKVFELMISLKGLIESIEELSSIPNTFSGQDLSDAFAELGEKMVNYLLILYLQNNYPLLHNSLVLLGIIDVKREQLQSPRIEYISWTFNWNNLSELFSQPEEVLTRVYNWGNEGFNPEKLFLNIRNVLWFLGIPAGFQNSDPEGIKNLESGVTEENPILRIPITRFEDSGNLLEIGTSFLPIKEGSEYYTGFAVVPYGFGTLTIPIELGLGWMLSFELNTATGPLFGLTIHPPFEMNAGMLAPGDTRSPQVSGGVTIEKDPPDDKKVIIIGKADESRLEAGAFGLSTSFSYGQRPKPDFTVELYIKSAAVVIKPGGGDGFITKILPSDGITAPFDFKLGWNSIDGLYFEGSVGLEVTLPIHKSLGPVELKTIYLRIMINTSGNVEVRLATSLGVELGPFTGVVERIGLEIESELKAKQKTNIRFLPPLGVGFSVNTSGLIGGGYLELDYENERYSGILQLSYGSIGLIAITVITTRFPDGSKGFSMLGIISIEIDPPISLPYNFYFHGGGGLFGINRTMNLDIIAQRLKDGVLSNTFFPSGNVIARAPEIMADINDIFPPIQDRYVFGVMVKLSWSQVIFGNLGIVLEVPMPIKIAFVGQIYTHLPEEDNAIIELHLDILGALDLEKKKLYFMCSLYDSRVLILELFGDSYIGLCWAPGNSYFVMSLGGFHPNDKSVPTDIPSLRRLTIALSQSENLRIIVESYFALTPKTLAFGCHLDLYAGCGDFCVVGYFGFDALFIFSPFSFETQFSAGAAIKMGGSTLLSLRLELDLSGPAPWHVYGSASFKILFIEVSVDVSATWGESRQGKLPNYDPFEDLIATLHESKSWGALESPNQTPVSTTDAGSSSSDNPPIIVPPNGYLIVDQNVVPLNTSITKYKNETPVGEDVKFEIDKIYIKSTGHELCKDDEQNYFSRPQFQQMSKSKQLSLPQFELMNSGIKAHGCEMNLEHRVDYTLEYENEFIDENNITHSLPPVQVFWKLSNHLLQGSILSQNIIVLQLNKIQPMVKISDQGFSIAISNTLTAVDGYKTNMTHTEASEVLTEYLVDNPQMEGFVSIVPSEEVA
ncbi:MAG: DUF6603 domain-containing protein [Candidatus Hodarchaeota archaeon]